MSKGGQVWLVTPERFFTGFERQFNCVVPPDVRLGLRLFIGPVPHEEMLTILDGRPARGLVRKQDGVPQEFHQERFVAATLAEVLPSEWAATIAWIQQELPRITELCFSCGLCSTSDGRAEFIWYYISSGGNASRVRKRLVPVGQLIDAIKAMPERNRAVIGPRNGGSTILLPFGFLQMHRPAGGNQLQFHHGLDAIAHTLGT
jgi:hypothetical protein